jgi:uncharacterized membrane protein YbhN (UPF0104 family)
VTPERPADPLASGEPTPAPGKLPLWRRALLIPTPVIFVGSLALALILLWRQGTLGDLGETARNADTRLLVIASVLYLVSVVVLCLRWQALVEMAGGRHDPARAAEALLTSVVVNYAAPKGLAVPTRAMLSARDLGLSATASSAVALWDVGLDFAALSAMSLVWFALTDRGLLRRIDLPDARYSAGLVIVIALLGLVVAATAWRRPRWRERGVAALREMATYPGRRPGAALAAVGFTVAYWTVQTVVFRLMLEAVGLGDEVSWAVVLGLMGPPVLIGMFSPTPGGSGVREALMVVVAQAGGLPGAPVLLAAVVYRVALLVAVPVLYALVRLWRQGRARSATPRRTANHE